MSLGLALSLRVLVRAPLPLLLRPRFTSSHFCCCLRRQPSLSKSLVSSYTTAAHLRTAVNFRTTGKIISGEVINGYVRRGVHRKTLRFVRHYWKRCVTVGTLCGGGVLLGGVAASGGREGEGSGTLCPTQNPPSVVTAEGHLPGFHVADMSNYCEATFGQFTLLEKTYVALRFIYLSILFWPTAVLYGVSRLFHSSRLESLTWTYTMRAVQVAGPAFIKLGQWASTRRDLFSEEFCNSLSQLHTACQPHRWRDTRRTLEEEFGHNWEEILEISDREPIGSGCVAQVYKGYLKTTSASAITTERGTGENENSNEKPTRSSKSVFSKFTRSRTAKSEGKRVEEERAVPVAVKVLHPCTVQNMERDMLLMRYGAYWMDWLYPDFHWVALKECFSEFSTIMRKQLDMELEARNLRHFQQIMGDRDCVKFPTPLFPFVTKSVLVETFEAGSHISNYMDNPGGELQKSLARIGIEALLDMLFIHNFVHGDLHPGNILVQETLEPRIVLLDCGIATSLTPYDLQQMRKLFTAIIKGEGECVADLMLGSQACSTVEEYRRNMADLVTQGLSRLNHIQNTRVSNLFSQLFDVLIKHKVRIQPNYTSVFVAIMVIEGLGQSLDPSLNLLEVATPCLLHRVGKDLVTKIRGS